MATTLAAIEPTTRSPNMNQDNITIIQTHSGEGDNVARDKILNIIKTLAPQDLEKPVEDALSKIRANNKSAAKIIINTIKSTNNLNNDVHALMEILSIHSELIDNRDMPDAYGKIVTLLRHSDSKATQDIGLAALLKLSQNSEDEADTIRLYRSTESPGPYSKEIYCALYASYEELAETFTNSTPTTSEGELIGMFRGLIRNNKNKLASEVAKKLNRTYPSLNSRVYSLISEAFEINEQITTPNSWFISNTLKNSINQLADKAVELLLISKGQDLRLYDIAGPTLEYLSWPHKKLYETCTNYIEELEKNHPKIAANLRSSNNDHSKLNDSLREFATAHEDASTRQLLINRLSSSKEIDANTLLLYAELATQDELIRWKDNGGRVVSDTQFSSDFGSILLDVVTLKAGEKSGNTLEISSKIDNFIEAHGDVLSEINQTALQKLAVCLIQINLPQKCSEILRLVIPKEDLWLSPPVQAYLHSLVNSSQFRSFSDVLSIIPEKDNSSFIWHLRAIHFEHIGSFKDAIDSANRSTELNPQHLEAWEYVCTLYKKYTTNEELLELSKKIPENLLSELTPSALRILAFIAQAGDFPRAEQTLIRWFIQSPSDSAIPISNFHFNACISLKNDLLASKTVEQCIEGIRYKKENIEFTRLIVDSTTGNNPYLLSINSPLYQVLSKLDVNETQAYNMEDITLLERLYPYPTVLRLSTEIRNIENDGSDTFTVLNIPSDPELMIEFLAKKLGQNSSQERAQKLLSDQSIPIFIKGHLIQNGNPFKMAAIVLSDKQSSLQPLFDNGADNPEQVILDAYSIAYLALTGLAYAIPYSPVEFHITPETKEALINWLSEIKDDNYMTLDVGDDGQLIRTRAEDIREHSNHFLEGLQIALDNTKLQHPNSIDLPIVIFSIADGIDATVLSSIRLSIANNTPWLCIDRAFAELHHINNHKTVNTHTFFTELGRHLNFHEKQHGLRLYALHSLPFPLTFADIRMLTLTEDASANAILYNILKNYGKYIFTTETELDLLLRYTSYIIFKEKRVENSFFKTASKYKIYTSFAEHIVNYSLLIIISSKTSESAELKLAKAIIKLVTFLNPMKHLINQTIELVFLFADGHFLDRKAILAHIEKLNN